MKKIKFLGAAVLAASLIFAGCANGSDDEDYSAPETPAVENPTDSGDGTDQNNNNNGGDTNNNNGGNNGGNTGNNNSGNNGGNEAGDTEDDEDIETNYNAPDLSSYYKKSLLGATGIDTVSWDGVSTNTTNDDGSISIIPGTKWGSSTSCLAIQGFEAGTLANYDYIVFTLDTTNFTFIYDEEDPDNRNDGVNIKIPEVMKELSSKYVADGKLRTYYAAISDFGSAPETADQFALIVGGTGTLKVTEVYLAATENPAEKAITGITISPASASLQKNGTLQFTVKDSKFVNRTSEVTYTLSGDANDEACSITNEGLLTVGTKAGELTVTASYTVNEKTFTSSATITVLGELTNLITDIQFKKMYLSNTDWQPYVDNVENVDELPEEINFSMSEEGTISFTTLVDTANTYNTQLFLTTDADLHEGDEWLFSCKIGGVDGTWTIKLNDATALIPLQTGSFTTAGSEVSFCSPAAVTSANASENIVLFFAFSPSPAGTITISDIVLTKTN